MIKLMRIISFFLVFILTTPCFSQIEYPPLSFKSTLVQQVGFTTFTVNYERPLQRGRELFGVLVPYGQPWKTGAGFHNTIGFDKPVSANGKLIAPGVYHLVTIPDQNNWKVILTTDSLVFSKNKPYQPEYEVMRIDAAPKNIQTHYEALNIDIDVVNNNAELTIAWGNTSISFTLETNTTNDILAQIEKMERRGNLSAEQYEEMAQFISYYVNYLPLKYKDMAIRYINIAMKIQFRESMFRTKRNIYWVTNDVKGVEAVTGEWISYLKLMGDDNSATIKRLEEELVRFKMR